MSHIEQGYIIAKQSVMLSLTTYIDALGNICKPQHCIICITKRAKYIYTSKSLEKENSNYREQLHYIIS